MEVKINNGNPVNAKTLTIKAYNSASNAPLDVYVDDGVIEKQTIEPLGFKVIKVDVSGVDNMFELELRSNSSGGGISAQQTNSSSGQGNQNSVVITIN